MSRIPDKVEIDFDADGCSKETTSTKVAVFAEKLRSIKNPYTGNKRKLLVNLFTAIGNHGWQYDTFLDLFSGSGMVSACARHLGKSVTANDLSPFAYQNARFFLHAEKGLSQEDIDILTKPDKHDFKPLVSTYYAERFTPDEAIFLDEIRKRINIYLPGGRYGGQSMESTIALLSVLHYVMDRCFVGGRLNKGQVIAELGHRISHQRNGGQAMSFKDIEWLKPFVSGPFGSACNEDAIELLNKFNSMGVVHDIVYIDPPYGSSQSNYSQMYQFFNDYIVGQRVEDTEQAQRFVVTKTYSQQFDDLLVAARKNPRLVFSYNNSSWSKIDDIILAVRRFRARVDVHEVRYDYNYRDKEVPGTEYIILAE